MDALEHHPFATAVTQQRPTKINQDQPMSTEINYNQTRSIKINQDQPKKIKIKKNYQDNSKPVNRLPMTSIHFKWSWLILVDLC